MRSSPNVAVMGEAHEMPLKYRRMFLSYKNVLKIRQFNYNNVLNGLSYVAQEYTLNPLIILDSQSVLKSISKPQTSRHFLIHKIVNILNLLRTHGKYVTFVWIRGHCGITGNELADRAARNPESELSCCIFAGDLLADLKHKLKREWTREYSMLAQSGSGQSQYYRIHPQLPKKIDYLFSQVKTRFYSSSITRLKLNHGVFRSHLYRLGLVDSVFCECDGASVCDVNHLFFKCPNHVTGRDKFMESLIKVVSFLHLIYALY